MGRREKEASLFSNMGMSGSKTEGQEAPVVPLASVGCKRWDSFFGFMWEVLALSVKRQL